MRFGQTSGPVVDSAEVMEKLAEDKQRREARALKFGITTNEML